MAKCKSGAKKVKGRCVPNKGCKFKKNGGGAVTCKSGGAKKRRRKTSRKKASSSCGAGLKKGKGGRCVLKSGYRYAKGGGGRTVKAR